MLSDGIAAAAASRHRSLLRSCALGRSSPSHGHQLHALLLKTGLLLSSIPSNIPGALFHMYAAIGPPDSALCAFNQIPELSSSAADWTALASCHARAGLPTRAILIFRAMRRSAAAGNPTDAVAVLPLLSAAARLADPYAAAAAHILLLKLGLPFSTHVRNAAVHAYVKSGLMDEARRLFEEMPNPTVVSWTTILTGSLRWESLSAGREIFDRMPERNEVAWTVVIAAYIEAALPRDALSLLARLLFGNISLTSLNHVSLCSILSACSQAGDLTVGRWAHTHVVKNCIFSGQQESLMVDTALIDMYAKCGRVGAARKSFAKMSYRNVVTWNAMLGGLSMHGLGTEVLQLFSQMVTEDEHKPDDITLVSVLSACSRSGFVDEGRKLFSELSSVYGLVPKVEHYACMVDLLGRAGRLEEAETLIREMPIHPNEVVLGSLLASCCFHGKLELGRRLMQDLVQIDPHNTDYHVLLSNMFTTSGMQSEANDLRQVLKRRGIHKTPGLSFIELDGKVHRFYAGDKSHPQTPEVYAMVDEMSRRLRLAGYKPDAGSQISLVSDDFMGHGDEQEEREQVLWLHSERLAIALGLISTRPGATLRIFKNLRICNDCHVAIKLMSDIFEREIIVRDRNRFHCFKQGVCSCSDYW